MNNVNSKKSTSTPKPNLKKIAKKAAKGCAKPDKNEDCKRMVRIFPLRYGVIASTKTAERNKLTPDFPGNLGGNLVRSKLKEARYAVKKLRPGYLYVFTQRIIRDANKPSTCEFKCEASFVVSEHGKMMFGELKSEEIRLGGYIGLLVIDNVPNIQDFRLLFTPDPLTPRMIERIAKEDELRQKLQFFDLAANMKSPTEADVLAPELIHKHLAESIAEKLTEQPYLLGRAHKSDFELVKVMEKQLYTPALLSDLTLEKWERRHVHSSTNYASHLNHTPMITTQYHVEHLKAEDKDTGRGFAVVLDDAIGITQALNAWRNAGIEDVLTEWFEKQEPWLGKKPGEKKKTEEKTDEKADKNAQTKEKAAPAKAPAAPTKTQAAPAGKADAPAPEPLPPNAPTNERMLNVAIAYEQIKQGYIEGMARRIVLNETPHDLRPDVMHSNVNRLEDRIKKRREARPDLYTNKNPNLEALRQADREDQDKLQELKSKKFNVERLFDKKLQMRLEAKTDELAFNDKYSKLIDEAAMQTYRDVFNAETEIAYKVMQGREDDHLVWLLSEKLLDALAVYDDDHAISGWHYASQTGLCIMGADGAPRCGKILEKQWHSNPMDIKNLALRGFAHNQKKLLEALVESQKDAQRLHEEEMAAMKDDGTKTDALTLWQTIEKQVASLQTMKKAKNAVVNPFYKIIKFYDNFNRALYSKWTPSQSLGAKVDAALAPANAWIASLSTQLMKSKYMQALDVWFPLYRTWLSSTLDQAIVQEYIKTHPSYSIARARQKLIDPDRDMAGFSRTDRELSAVRRLGGEGLNDFHEVRIATWTLIFDACMLIYEAHNMPAAHRDKWIVELTASAFALGAAGLEVLMKSTEILMEGYPIFDKTDELAGKAWTAKMASTRLRVQQLKFLGSSMTMIAGILTAWPSYKEGKRLRMEGRSILAITYHTRFTLLAAGSISTGLIAYGVARPVFWALSKWYKGGFTKFLLRNSIRFGFKSVVALLGRFNALVMVLLVIIEFGIYLFEDTLMKKWCIRSSFRGPDYRKSRSDNTYFSTDDELGALCATLQEAK